jgi:transposase
MYLMDRPKVVNELLVKYPELRSYVNYLEKANSEKNEMIEQLSKDNQLLSQRISSLEHNVNALKEHMFKPSKRKDPDTPSNQGAKEGHEAHHRPKPDHVDATIDLALTNCPKCNHALGNVMETRERLIEDIQPAKPVVTKYKISRYYCPCCGELVNANPPEIPYSRFGINLLLHIEFMRYGLHLPQDGIAKSLETCFGIHVSVGTIVNELSRFAAYAGPLFEQIKKEIREAAAVNGDETSWRRNGLQLWLWTFTSKWHTLLLVSDSRGKEVPKEVLGEYYAGTLTTDCLPTYDSMKCAKQKCWAHLLRETKRMKSEQGKLMLAELKHVLGLAKSKEFSKEDMLAMLDSIINQGFTDYWCKSLVKRIVKYKHEWFTFMDTPGVDPTNNAAERSLRPSVVMRKITGGSRSDKGVHCHEVGMSVMATWEKQGKDFMAEADGLIRAQLP